MPTYDRLPPQSYWEVKRSKSRWHFDYTKPPVEGSDSFTKVCRFKGDFFTWINFVKETKKCFLDMPSYSGDIKKDADKFSYMSQNLAFVGANPYTETVDVYLVDDIPIFKSISNNLGLKESFIKLDIQRPGQMLAAHIDDLGSLKRSLDKKGINIDINNETVKRFAIMLDDWKLGHFFQLGNATWHQWSAGDCITWEWEDIPHCTGNAGYWERPMLQITGLITDQTRELMNSEKKDIVIEV